MHRDRARITASLHDAHAGRCSRKRETGGRAGEWNQQRAGTGVVDYREPSDDRSSDGRRKLDFDNAGTIRRQGSARKRTRGATDLDLEIRTGNDAIQGYRAGAVVGDG